jgi:hypothetical protein
LYYICFATNIFNPLKYAFLLLFTIYNITPYKLKKNNTVPTIERISYGIYIGFLVSIPIFSIVLYENTSDAALNRKDYKYIKGFLNFIR